MTYSNLTAHELLVWARDSFQYLIDRDLINLEESSAQELIDRIDTYFDEAAVRNSMYEEN